MGACTGNSHARNWLRAQHVHKPVLAYSKKRAPRFSILLALVITATCIYYCPLVVSPTTITNCCRELHPKFGWVPRSVFENITMHKNHSGLVWKPVFFLLLSKCCTFIKSHPVFPCCSLQYDEMFLISLLDGCYESSRRFKVKITCKRVNFIKK